MRSLKLLIMLVAAAVRQFANRVVWPDEGKSSVPPIRYDGDPRDIYLA